MICLAKTQFFLDKTMYSFSTPPSFKVQLSPYSPTCSLNQEHRRKTIHLQKKAFILETAINPQRIKIPSTVSRAQEVGGGMWAVCGFGYWMQGFRCFPWLALNFHLVHALKLSPAALQLVQNTGNLPMVAKPLFGVLSDVVHIGGAHRIPYITIGVILQLISWGTLAIMPAMKDMFPATMACILLSNLGASVTEVVSDALVAEFSKLKKTGQLQSYAFIALAAGTLIGNLSGGFFLLKIQEPKIMFSAFALLLLAQPLLSLTAKEKSLSSHDFSSGHIVCSSVSDNLSMQLNNLITAINDKRIFYPLSWIVASVAIVPILSGSMFCFQTQFLKLDPSIIGLSKVSGQLMVLAATVLYERHLERIPMRGLILGTQILYAFSLLSDMILVKQINLTFNISNEAYVLCLSAFAEAIAQFKILPFSVLFSQFCPSGCEGSLFAFFASAMCLSSILSGIFGVGLASFVGITSVDYSKLPLGIALQFIAALVPVFWISSVPNFGHIEDAGIAKRSKDG